MTEQLRRPAVDCTSTKFFKIDLMPAADPVIQRGVRGLALHRLGRDPDARGSLRSSDIRHGSVYEIGHELHSDDRPPMEPMISPLSGSFYETEFTQP